MAQLFSLQGDAVAGVEGVLSRLEHSSARPDAVRYLRAQFYLRPPEGSLNEQRPLLRTKAQQTLESLVASSTGFYQRKALATLAALHFDQRHHAEARSLYQRYVAAYPDAAYAWVAALRTGQCDESLNNPKAGADTFRAAAAQFGSNPLARVLGAAYAARAAEAAGDFRQALVDDRAALAAWDDDYGLTYSLYSTRQATPDERFMFVDDAEVAKPALAARISQLQRATRVAGGTVVERGRWLLMRGRWDEAILELSPLLRPSLESAVGIEARYLSHRARLERALDAADVDKADSDAAKALTDLEALSREPFDFAVGAAKIALASLASVRRASGDANALMIEALTAWHAADRREPPSASRGALEWDVVGIRNAVFLPKGGGVFGNSRWNAFSWSGASARFLVVDPDLRVKLSDGTVVRVTAYDRFPDFDNILFLPDERRILLERIMIRVGGTKKRQPGAIMETPNQPVGPSLDVLTFWKPFFARAARTLGWLGVRNVPDHRPDRIHQRGTDKGRRQRHGRILRRDCANGKERLIATLQQEVRILLHLAGKVERSMLGYRPTPKQRSTLELLQYMAIMGPTQLTVIEHGVFDRPTLSATWSPAEAEAKKMSFDQAVAAIEQQSDEYARRLGAWTDAEFRKEVDMFGRKPSPADARS